MNSIIDRVELQTRNYAFNHRIHTFAIVDKIQKIDIESFLKDAFIIYESEMECILELHNTVKSVVYLFAEFEKKIQKVDESENKNANDSENVNDIEGEMVNNGGEVTIKKSLYFGTPNVIIGLDSDLTKHFELNIVEEVMNSVETTAIQGSGFTLSRIIELVVQVAVYNPLGGSSYVKTPEKLAKKGAIINVNNPDDNKCFKWAILSHKYSKQFRNPQRVSNYKRYENDFNFDGIDFPVGLKDINKFTEQNENISINVYYYDDHLHQVFPLRLSKVVKTEHIHLLLLVGKNEIDNPEGNSTADNIKFMLEDDEIRLHYCYIKDLSRLISSQLSKHGHKLHICDRCLNYFQTKKNLDEHMLNCTNDCQIEMPVEANKWMEFKNHQKQLRTPFVIYADTETFLKPLNAEEQNRVFSEKCETTAYQEHRVHSIGYYFKCEYNDELSFYASCRDPDKCLEWFIDELKIIAIFVENQLSQNVPMKKLDSVEELLFNDPSTVCSICGLAFEMNDTRVRDHCHLTGRYRGPAHAACNLNYQDSREIPIIMHNLSGYDAHLFIKKLSSHIEGDISIIPNNAEQYISFTKVVEESSYGYSYHEKIKLKFIDSCRFMQASLSSLAELIPTDRKRILYAECGKNYTPEQIAMLERKGVFPYDYVDSVERLEETSLPPKEQFYSQLNEDSIDDAEYDFACEVWNKFNIKTLAEYSDLYLKTDVLLLADVFENFRATCHNIYKLDPTHYYTAAGLSFDAMLKYTGVQIELITDVEMLLFVERGIRGGISQCSKRHTRANHKYMKELYNPNEESRFLMYLDGKFTHSYSFKINLNQLK